MLERRSLILWLVLPLLYVGTDLFDSSVAHIALFLLSAIIVLVTFRRDMADPRLWFVCVLALYSVCGPITVLAGGRALSGPETAALSLHHLAMVAFVLGCCVVSGVRLRMHGVSREFGNPALESGALTVGFVCFIASVGLVIAMMRYATVSKMDVTLVAPLFWRAQALLSVFLLCVFALVIASRRNSKRLPTWIWFFALWFVIIAVVTKERDIVLRFFVTLLIIQHLFFSPLKPARLATFGVALLVGTGLLGVMRTVPVSGRQTTIWEQTMGGEFRTSWANVSLLVGALDSQSTERPGQNTIVADVVQAFGSSTLLDDRSIRNNGSAWFNRVFFPSLSAHGGGRGFSLVGEFYLNSSVLGVALGFALLGSVLGLARRSVQNPTHGLIYCLCVPGTMYAIRMDVSTLLSYTIKQIVLTALVIWLVGLLLAGGRRRVPPPALARAA